MKRAFTVIELLVTITIIGILAAVLIPTIGAVQRSSRQTKCANNMRQIATALVSYAGSNGGAYPPNSAQIKQFWYDDSLIGMHVTGPIKLPDGSLAGGVFSCPDDLDDAIRSYSMNIYASGYVSSGVRAKLDAEPLTHGRLFKFGVAQSSMMLLLVESWSELPQPAQEPKGHAAQAIVGFVGRPGERFGAGRGIVWTDPPDATPNRFPTRASQIAFDRHRRETLPREDPRGRANFAFGDGHVEVLKQSELVISNGRSSYRALWSPLDREIEDRAFAPTTNPSQ